MSNIVARSDPAPAQVLTRAAQYVRMSTEHQKYSTESQMALIADYAIRHRYSVVRTYLDHGKSGLTLVNRHALRQLLDDVQSRETDYSTILVYDVSRWGRFQDADESAHYEYVCRRCGVAVLYCAEPFENDGSIYASVVKSLKRAMAAEYSRELSKKVYAAQVLNVQRGFKNGGAAPYGFRRALLKADGSVQQLLTFGERKAVLSQRVALVRGPPAEVDVVRWVFREFAYGAMDEVAIAKALNARRVSNVTGRAWTAKMIESVLRKELYTGVIIWNRTKQTLSQRPSNNPPDQWIRIEDGCAALVDHELFAAAQGAVRARKEHRSDDALLERLRVFASQNPVVSQELLRVTPGMPRGQTFARRFGSLTRALRLVGADTYYDPQFIVFKRGLRAVREGILSEIRTRLERNGATVRRFMFTLTIDDEISVSVAILKTCISRKRLWRTRTRAIASDPHADFIVVARMNDGNTAVADYLVLPGADYKTIPKQKSRLRFGILEAHRYDTIDELHRALARVQI